MRLGLVVLTLSATPAFAHHETVVATSIVPLAIVASSLGVGVIGAVMSYVRKRRSRRSIVRIAADQD